MGLFDDDEGEWINTNLIKAATAAGGTAKGPLGRLGSALQERPRGPQEPIRTSTSGATAYGVYAGLSCEGYGKGSQVGGTNNQDSFAVNSLGNGIDLLGVFDGHGKAGGECSAFIAAEMARQLEAVSAQLVAAGTDAEKARGPLTTVFENTHAALMQNDEVDSLMSGSTAIAVMVVTSGAQRHLLIASAGDCRVILGAEGWGGKQLCSQLSVDQSPDRPDEQQRIEALGGVIGMVDFTLDDPRVISIAEAAEHPEDLGPPRVFFKDDTWDPPYDTCFPGLAMSRSIGDSILDELGVSPTPEVFARPLKAKDRFIVVASDGVWQVLSNDEVAACVGQAGGDPAAACDIIYDSAAKRWAGKEDAPYRDDITSLVLLLQ